MQILSANSGKSGFGRLIDLARAEPVSVTKHGQTVVIEDHERFKALEAGATPQASGGARSEEWAIR